MRVDVFFFLDVFVLAGVNAILRFNLCEFVFVFQVVFVLICNYAIPRLMYAI